MFILTMHQFKLIELVLIHHNLGINLLEYFMHYVSETHASSRIIITEHQLHYIGCFLMIVSILGILVKPNLIVFHFILTVWLFLLFVNQLFDESVKFLTT